MGGFVAKEISVVSLRLVFAYLNCIPWCLNRSFLRLPQRRFFYGFAQDCFKDCGRNGLEQVLIETRRPASRQIFRATADRSLQSLARDGGGHRLDIARVPTHRHPASKYRQQ
jgi:hypothetical protein